MKLYLAGPMRGFHLFNFPAFFSASLHLKSLGHDVTNPAERDMAAGLDPSDPDLAGQGLRIEEMFEFDFKAILAAEGVVFLPGWQESRGACAERVVAHFLGRACYDFDEREQNGLRAQGLYENPVITWSPKMMRGGPI